MQFPRDKQHVQIRSAAKQGHGLLGQGTAAAVLTAQCAMMG
jgi:hypothetical protein